MAAASIAFTDTCTFTRAGNGSITVAWDNGSAIAAVRGAAIDYVDPRFHMAVTRTANTLTYAPAADLARLIAGGLNAKMALVIVGMRRICASFPGVELNIAEVQVVPATEAAGVVPEADWNALQTNLAAFRALLDIAPTVLGMNGLSLMLKGHNYIESDSMWARLESAAGLDGVTSSLALVDYAGTLFHDALHPFTAESKVSLASDVASPLIGHVNGVLVKRLPGVPAGTALVFVTRAALEEVVLMRPSAARAVRGLKRALERLGSRIRQSPLDWCTVFQRADTAANLAQVAKLEPLCAFVYGACTVLFEKKVSIMKSASFKNNAARHTAMTSVGKEWGSTLEELAMDAEAIEKMFRDSVIDAVGETEDEEEEDDEDEE